MTATTTEEKTARSNRDEWAERIAAQQRALPSSADSDMKDPLL
jgi:hypothetical protein